MQDHKEDPENHQEKQRQVLEYLLGHNDTGISKSESDSDLGQIENYMVEDKKAKDTEEKNYDSTNPQDVIENIDTAKIKEIYSKNIHDKLNELLEK